MSSEGSPLADFYNVHEGLPPVTWRGNELLKEMKSRQQEEGVEGDSVDDIQSPDQDLNVNPLRHSVLNGQDE